MNKHFTLWGGIFLLFGLFFSLPVFAEINIEPLLNKVTLQLHAEEWVTTRNALVNIDINATVNEQGIEKTQNYIMQKLNEISNASEWHVLSLNRQLDKSGLESIQMTAQARLAQSELNNLRDKLKNASKPGETFMLQNIQFVPSENELRQANNKLRENIYEQVKAEIESLNKLYPDQKYYLHEVDFISAPLVPAPSAVSGMMVTSRMVSTKPIVIDNKLEMQATVIIAAMQDQINKIVHD